MAKTTGKRNKTPKTRKHRDLGGSLVSVKARPGAIFGQLRRDGKRVQRLLVSAVDASELDHAAKLGLSKDDARGKAEKLLAAWALEVETRAPSDGSTRAVTLTEFLAEFYPLAESRVGERHADALRHRLDRAATYFGTMPMADIGRAQAEDYMTKLGREDGRLEKRDLFLDDGTPDLDENGKQRTETIAHPMSAQTLKTHRSALSACWTAAMDRQAAESNPWRAVRVPKGQQFVARLLTRQEVESILARVVPQIRPIVSFLAETGLRLGEVQALTWQCVERDLSKVTVAKSKSGRSRIVPTTAAARAILEAAKATRIRKAKGPDYVFRKYERSYVWHKFQDACIDAGLGRGVRVHDLRHHVGTSLAQAGVPIPTIMGILGHSQIATTQRYAAHLPSDAAATAFAAMEAMRGERIAPKSAATA